MPDSVRYYVLECSRIRTEPEFWDHLNRTVSANAGLSTVNSIESLRKTLLGSARSPGRCILEIRNIELLEAAGNRSLTSGLEAIGRELEERSADVELVLLRFPAPPRGLLYQHASFASSELEGDEIEKVVRSIDSPSSPCVIWVKPERKPWQRFYLDAGFSCWEELSERDAFLGFDEDELCDIGAARGLVGKHLGRVIAFCDSTRWGLRVHVKEGGLIQLEPEDPTNLDSRIRIVLR